MNITLKEMMQYGVMLVALGVSWATLSAQSADNTADIIDLQVAVSDLKSAKHDRDIEYTKLIIKLEAINDSLSGLNDAVRDIQKDFRNNKTGYFMDGTIGDAG